MSVVINEFEITPEPPREAEPEGQPAAAPQKLRAEDLHRMMRRACERRIRTLAH